MAYRYEVHPSIGVARVGNSPHEFYLEPESIGGLPLECDPQGNVRYPHFDARGVTQFKDGQGRIKRQGARFRIFRYDDSNPDDLGTEVTLEDSEVKGIEWTVHLANKKAVWYQFSELEGDLMLGEWKDGQNTNSYAAHSVPVRNASVTDESERQQQLIIDPGPRTLSAPEGRAEFSRDTIPSDYKHGSFPPPHPSQGTPINTLGEMLTDKAGRLVVLGGFGNAGGDEPIDTFAGADTWFDDISDGPVNCRLTLTSGETLEMQAWLLVGSPKFAPQLVNIVTLGDIMFDVGVRYMDLLPDLFSNGQWNPDYEVNFSRDIAPIMRRIADYQWVSNVQSMSAFASPWFNPTDASEGNRRNREVYFSYFRNPGTGSTGEGGQQLDLWAGPGQSIPLMPLNSGSNSVSNAIIDKFLTLTETQYFQLGQWAAGKFNAERPRPYPGIHPQDWASVGNCVGAPMCPGIEVTWSTRNPPIYAKPFHIKQQHDVAYYYENGLSPTHDECDPDSGGCQPGDLTKRMAIPWQADFFQCTAQYVNFTDEHVNKAEGIPAPPTYYAYWWPPQSPMYVLNGATSLDEQLASGVPAGFQVYYPRGINSFAQMITAWSYMGFILNQNQGEQGRNYPYFTERERNHDQFEVATVAVGQVSNFVNPEDTTFWPVWYLKPEAENQTRALTPLPGTRGPVRSPSRGHHRVERRERRD